MDRALPRPLDAHRILRWIILAAGAVAWATTTLRAAVVVATASSSRPEQWLHDWHVYAAGAEDLIARDLYRVPLEYPGWPLPVDVFNLPPMSAAWALPLYWLPGEWGGWAWVAAGWAMWLGSWWVLAASVLRLRHAWVIVGVAAAVYSRFMAFDLHVTLGNINDLVLGLLTAFVLLHLNGQHRAAGTVLGLAVATKVWPATLLLLLLREGRWMEILWCLGTIVVTGLAMLTWLGLDTVPHMIDGLRTSIPVVGNNPTLGPTWVRENTGWWPWWGALALAAVLLAIPVRGARGIGLGLLAGMTLIPNLWGIYFPTVAVAIALAVLGMRKEIQTPDVSRSRWSLSRGKP